MTLELLEKYRGVSLSERAPQLLVIGSGKGGVGKTCFAVNLAVEVARRGWQVILVDADLSCSNVEAVLGMESKVKLDDFFYQRGSKRLNSLIIDTPYQNLKLIPGTTGLLDVANPKYQQKLALIRELKALEADLIILDLDAGAHLNTLDFYLLSDNNGVIVIAPEKTSIDNAFKFIRAALFRRIEKFYQSPEVAILLKRNETLVSFIETLQKAEVFAIDEFQRIRVELLGLARAMKPRIVVNRVFNSYEAHVAVSILRKLLRKTLCVDTDFLGFIYFDSIVQESVNYGRPFIVQYPGRRVSKCIGEIADRLGFFGL